jgi:hypothetical protein
LNAMICTPGWLGVQITGWVAHGASLLTHITNQVASCVMSIILFVLTLRHGQKADAAAAKLSNA